jgi:crotonobetainyl-CoA:carnitine CoA-transferase CaiB-like acyl-CoA transferase/acyl-CoA thioesterase
VNRSDRPEAPLAGVRVLDLTAGQAGRTAAMLLADLGGDVVRVRAGAEPDPGPEGLCWDRGKRRADAPTAAEVDRLTAAADVVLSDTDPGEPRAGQARVWLPPYAATGRWAGLPADPLLLGAVGGFAGFHPALDGGPVASVVPLVEAVHGALGAAAAVAALLGVRRTGHGTSVVVSGLHASAACLGSMAVEGLDVDRVFSPGTRLPGAPNFRVYRAGDGRWLQLAALTPGFFFGALDVLDRMDVMALDGVDGEFTHLLIPEVGGAVGRELESAFATRPRDEWLAAFEAAGVPAAPVRTRDEWLADDIVADSATPLRAEHPDLGPVVMPGIPVRVAGGALPAPHLPGPDHVVPAAAIWPAAAVDRPVPAGPPPVRPLIGLRVVDLSTFLAAPLVAALLADMGAEVVKVETPSGDPYRIFGTSYAAVNQAKTVGALDLRDDAARAGLVALLREADVLVDNLRPASAARLGLGDDVLAGAGDRLVRCSVSAFGRSGRYADRPGFDPVLQALSGLAHAQGGADLPVATTAPVIDVATGVLGAFGVLAALYARGRTGRGEHVTVSLAATSTFLQSAELTTYPGRPEPAVGGRDHPGPSPTHRYHRAADGWLAVAATDPDQEAALFAVLGVADAAGIEAAIASRPVGDWVNALAARGVPACPVLSRDGALRDPFLEQNAFSHVVRVPELGRVRVVRGYADWPGGPQPAVARGWPRTAGLIGRAVPFAPVVPADIRLDTRPRDRTDPDLLDLLVLDDLGDDRFCAAALTADALPLYGGQVAAQALLAAGRTVGADRPPHSLHAYYLRAGSAAKPVELRVDRVRDGRSFSVRRVSAVQDGAEIFTMAASFHVPEPGAPRDFEPAPDAPAPDDLAPVLLGGLVSMQARLVPQPERPAEWPLRFWARATVAVPESALLRACMLTYLSDASSGLAAAHDGTSATGPTLDHAVWFHRPAGLDEWLLVDLVPQTVGAGRGRYTGAVRSADGALVASFTQEALFRPGPHPWA